MVLRWLLLLLLLLLRLGRGCRGLGGGQARARAAGAAAGTAAGLARWVWLGRRARAGSSGGPDGRRPRRGLGGEAARRRGIGHDDGDGGGLWCGRSKFGDGLLGLEKAEGRHVSIILGRELVRGRWGQQMLEKATGMAEARSSPMDAASK